MKGKILVLCTGNSCRSQMAEGYLKYFSNFKAEIFSAGIETHGVNHLAIKTMLDDGIDISHHTSNNIQEYVHMHFDHVITVCDNALESCPVFPHSTMTHHHNFSDPSKHIGTLSEIEHEFTKVRNEIKSFAKEFIKTYFE